MAKIHGGQIIARALKSEGVDIVFTLTGGHIVPILDGCVQEGIRVVDVRHEQAAVHAAEAYARLTGKLGVAAVTAGPGVTDAMTGVANAWHSNTPVLVIGGRHLVRQELMGGLQEMDHPRLLGSITAWAATAWQLDRLADYVATAARHAFAGRGAPVFLDIPMDVQFDRVEESAVDFPTDYRPTVRTGVDESILECVVDRLAGAKRPMIFSGAPVWPDSQHHLRELAETLGAPTYLNSRARGAIPHGHALLGNHTRSQAMAEADVVLAMGVDWDFRTGYGRKIADDAFVIQVDAEATRIGWNRPVHLGVVADPSTVVTQVLQRRADLARIEVMAWAQGVMEADHAAQAAFEAEAADDSSPVGPHRFARDVAGFFGPDAIVAVDGGDIVSTTARWLQVSYPGHVLDPGPFGTLGTGAPFALAAKIAFPAKRVGIVFGDGAFGFNGFEFDTMVRLGIPVVAALGNDGVWNNIKTFHRFSFPDRLVATDLGRRPYHAVVSALGGHGEKVLDPTEILPALHRAEASGQPALVDIHLAETVRMSSNYSQ